MPGFLTLSCDVRHRNTGSCLLHCTGKELIELEIFSIAGRFRINYSPVGRRYEFETPQLQGTRCGATVGMRKNLVLLVRKTSTSRPYTWKRDWFIRMNTTWGRKLLSQVETSCLVVDGIR